MYVPDPARDDDESVTSLGDRDAQGTTAFWFGDYTETSRKFLILRETALQAVKEWVESGRLTDRVTWTNELL